jgi:hypothetical protein
VGQIGGLAKAFHASDVGSIRIARSINLVDSRDSARRFYVADGKWDLLGDGWPEATSRSTGGFGWLRGSDLN